MKNQTKHLPPFRFRNWMVFSLFLLSISCQDLPQFSSTFQPFADFEEQESTLICWNKKYRKVQIPLITLIARKDHVTVLYNEKSTNPKIIEMELLQAKANLSNIHFESFNLEKDNVWIRDYGPSFMQDEEGNTVVVGFQYPHLAMKDYDRFNEQYSQKGKFSFFKNDLFGAGGGREINGQGTVILVESYEKEINPNLTKAQIEKEYQIKFNQQKVIWLKKGIPQDDFFGHGPVFENIYGYGAAGHVDEFCRFADENTILLTEVDSSDLSRDSFYYVIQERLEENHRILAESTDQDGQPFEIIRVPQAPVLFATAQLDSLDIIYTPVTSYLNFIITNKLVIIPAYYEEGAPDYVREKDEQALAIFKKAFPSREVFTINPIDLNYDGGGLHCITLPKHGVTKPKKRLKKRLL